MASKFKVIFILKNIRITYFPKNVCSLAMSVLPKYHWPGNVRELGNVIERAVVLAEETILVPENFPLDLGESSEREKVEDFFDNTAKKPFSFTSPRFMDKNVSMSAQRDFCLGNSLLKYDTIIETGE